MLVNIIFHVIILYTDWLRIITVAGLRICSEIIMVSNKLDLTKHVYLFCKTILAHWKTK